MNVDKAKETAGHCRHYAMCKIDYLGTGLCPSGPEKHYVAYYPQGRMDLYDALTSGLIPVTEALLNIADTCNLCGICDKQCHFATGLRPVEVMRALKERVAEHMKNGGAVIRPEKDAVLDQLRKIVGAAWAANDPAILLTYANDPFPLTDMKMPRFVVLPGSTAEVAAVVKLARRRNIPFAVRGNGGSVYGAVFSEGIVLDMNRMKDIALDAENWSAAIGPGVTSFELQQAAHRGGFRVNVAEPAATVCGNIICTGIFSTWSHAYGVGADHVIDMEFVDHQGRVFLLSDPGAPNVFAYQHGIRPAPGICTRAVVRLHPRTDDEEGLIVPFEDFDAAVLFARELGVRRIGLAAAVLGPHYLATFLSPARETADKLKVLIPESLGFQYGVFVIADRFGREAVRKMAGTVFDQRLMRALMLGLPRLAEGKWLDLVRDQETRTRPYELLARPEWLSVIETVLASSPETAASAVDEDLRGFYERFYRKPESTDLVWLNEFRVVSARMGRHKHIIAFIVFLPLDRPDTARLLIEEFEKTAEAIGIDHDFGFMTPLDFGKRAVFEYDYYIDQADPGEKARAGQAMSVLVPRLDELALTTKGFTWLKTIFSQGCARKESVLYRGIGERNPF